MPKKRRGQRWFDEEHLNSEYINLFAGKYEISGTLKVENYTKLKSISLKKFKLTKLKISNCKQLTEVHLLELSRLKSLSISDCSNLISLDCSKIRSLNELEVSLMNLKQLYCSSTLIKELSLNLCPNIIKLDCSNNEKLTDLDISNCSKLTNLNRKNCHENIKVSIPPELDKNREKNCRNLLIVGMTGGGKSTLANVLAGTENFKEGTYTVSETKRFKKQDFHWDDTKYRVVDTIGVGDTELPIKEVLYKIADGIYSMPEGISHVLFVIDGRFKPEVIAAFNMFKNSIFGAGILDYVTIVRTKFQNFRKEDECKMDKQKLIEQNEVIAKIINSCNEFIHVDNPPTNITPENGEDEETELVNSFNKKTRDKSRIILLDHLKKVCKNEFKFGKWDELHGKILKYVEEFENLNNLDQEFLEIVDLSKAFCLIL